MNEWMVSFTCDQNWASLVLHTCQVKQKKTIKELKQNAEWYGVREVVECPVDLELA